MLQWRFFQFLPSFIFCKAPVMEEATRDGGAAAHQRDMQPVCLACLPASARLWDWPVRSTGGRPAAEERTRASCQALERRVEGAAGA